MSRMRIVLHNESFPVDPSPLAAHLRAHSLAAEIRPLAGAPGLAERFARARVLDLQKREQENEPYPMELRFEERFLQGGSRAVGILYHGEKLQRIYLELIPLEERKLSVAHIFLTARLLATWDDGDLRYHARTSVYGYPHIVSSTGLVEAPAKPREFYLIQQQVELGGEDAGHQLKALFRGRFLDYDDDRLVEVAKGYVLQALFYQATGNPFCSEPRCRLWNAHWQEEMLRAQSSDPYDLCPAHQAGLLAMSAKS